MQRLGLWLQEAVPTGGIDMAIPKSMLLSHRRAGTETLAKWTQAQKDTPANEVKEFTKYKLIQ